MIKASYIITLVRVNDGKDAAVQSAVAPSDTSLLWCDTTLDPPQIKRYNPETASWVIVNDTAEVVYNLEQNFEASIEQTEGNILLHVAENHYLKDETESLVSSVATQLEQTAEGFTMQFTQFNADVQALANNTDAEFEEIRKYIRFEEGRILLGEEGNTLELQIANDRISFMQEGTEVAYFNNHKLYVTDGHFINSLQLGGYAFLPRSNGNLSFKKIEG